MATVHVPGMWRDRCGGADRVEVSASTLREVLVRVGEAHPELAGLLFNDGELRPEVAIAMHGAIVEGGLWQPVEADDDVYLVPALSGGAPCASRRAGTQGS